MRKNNVLLKGFRSHQPVKKMSKGGFSDTTKNGIMAAGTIADGVLDGLDPMDEFGTRTGAAAAGSGAIKGAMAGAALGPAGLIGGAVIGGATSFLGNKKAQELKQQTLTQRSDRAAIERDNRVSARIAADPNLKYGNVDAQMYKLGGTIKGVPSKKFSIGKMIPRTAGQAPDLLPDVAISPNKMARFADGGDIDEAEQQDPTKPKPFDFSNAGRIPDNKPRKISFGTVKKTVGSSYMNTGGKADTYKSKNGEKQPQEYLNKDNPDFYAKAKDLPLKQFSKPSATYKDSLDLYRTGEAMFAGMGSGRKANMTKRDWQEEMSMTDYFEPNGPVAKGFKKGVIPKDMYVGANGSYAYRYKKPTTPTAEPEPASVFKSDWSFMKGQPKNVPIPMKNTPDVPGKQITTSKPVQKSTPKRQPAATPITPPSKVPQPTAGQLDEVNITAKKLPAVSYPFGKRGETMTQEEWDYSRKKRGYPDVYGDKKRGTDNFIPGEIFSNEVRNDVNEYRKNNPPKKMAAGGIIPTSSGTSKVEGPSHANGGVKFPGAGVELEGGETMAGNFVFSKELGFAQIHDQIGKAMGRNEKKPLTVLNKNTQEALSRKEGFLKIFQEQVKKDKGIPNEIDGTADKMKQEQATTNVQMKFGGKIRKMADGGDLQDETQYPDEPKPKKGITVNEAYRQAYTAYNDYVKKGGKGKTVYNFMNVKRDPTTIINGGRKQPDKGTPYLTPWGTNPLDPQAVTSPLPPMATPTVKPAATTPASVPTSKGVARRKATISSTPAVATSMPQLPPLPTPGSVSDGYKSKIPVDLPKLATVPDVKIATGKNQSLDPEGKKSKIGEIIDGVAPFASNIANAFRRLPQPPKPNLDTELTPDFINLDADRAENVRQRRGADKVAAANLTSGNNISAVRAANLSQQVRSANEINQTEQNANTGIANQFQQINSQIRRGNNQKLDTQATQQVERQLKQQQLDSENIADVGNKFQLIKRDKAAADNEDTKNLLTILSDPTGATIRGAGTALKRIIKDPSVYDEIMKRGADMETMNKEERQANLDWIHSQINSIPGSTSDQSNSDVLNSTKMLSSDYKLNKDTIRQQNVEERLKISQSKKKK